ncbi:MAG: hypothetical protein KUG79_03210 [Pseudomonadales bacterium]|nr:hypothetical protein [Pseudomonadales bacterium]
MAKFNRAVMFISFVLCLLGFWRRNDLASDINFNPRLAMEPRQRTTEDAPFEVNFADINYHIEPQYNYEIYGLVVSYQHHNGNTGLHKLWNDHLNMADYCVVWSDTAFSKYLPRLEFWSGQFTCHMQTDDASAWAHFNKQQLSNNHLLSEDNYIRDAIAEIGIGDQVHIKGWLVNYSSVNGGQRGTSTVRTDTGNGACETIYVKQFEVIESYTSNWRWLLYVSLSTLLVSLIVYLKAPYRPHSNSEA